MDISSNQKASFPQSLPGSVMEAQNEPTTTLTSAAQGYELYRTGQFNPPQPRPGVSRGAVQQLRTMATAAIEGVLGFLNETTTMWGFPTKSPASTPSPSPGGGGSTIDQTKPAEKPPTSQTAAPSLIPSWAKIFEHTGNSEWSPGTNRQKSSIDLRKELHGQIEKIEILSADGTTVLATGTFERRGKDGRPRYRFDKAGSELPNGAFIKATLKPNKDGGHGGIRYIEIPNTNRPFKF